LEEGTSIGERNPYDWRSERPKNQVSRAALFQQATDTSLNGQGVLLLLGTRGAGKSVLLGQIRDSLRNRQDLEVLSFPCPPLPSGAALTAGEILSDLHGCLVDCAAKKGNNNDQFRKKLGMLAQKRQLFEMLESYLNEFDGTVERIVIFYDELDKYADGTNAGRSYFDAMEAARKRLDQRLVVVAAGGLGMLSLKTVLGSSFFSRADREIIEPFQLDEIVELANPLRERVDTLSEDVLPTLLVLSGGNPALATYGLEKMWGVTEPSSSQLQAAFDIFRDRNNDFCASIRGSIFAASEATMPNRVWRALKRLHGVVPQEMLRSIRQEVGAAAILENRDLFDMFRASGLVRMGRSGWRQDPVVADIIPSILSFDTPDLPSRRSCIRAQLVADLQEAMLEIHRMTPGFYVQGNRSQGLDKKLVPEASFAVGLALSMGGRGWRAELEPMSGAGFADIKAHHQDFGNDEAIVEVKIWGRRHETIHDQVTSYFTRGVKALATVVVTDQKDPGWKDRYEQECLGVKVNGIPEWKALPAPLEGYWEAQSGACPVDHFLLRLPSRTRLP